MKTFIIAEEEKKRILGMHKSATSNHYLTEQEDLKIQISEFPQVVQKFITDNGLNQNNFEWGDSSKRSANYKMSNGYMGLGTISMFESEVNTYNEMKPNLGKCTERGKRWGELTNDPNYLRDRDPRKEQRIEDTLNKEFPNMGGCGAAQKIQSLINGK